MHATEHETSSNMSRQIQIGRVSIGAMSVEHGFTYNWERAGNSGEAFFVLALPIDARMRFNYEGRIGIAEAGAYVLLNQTASYELSLLDAGTLLLVRIPAAELRSRLISIDEHVSCRFQADEHMTRLLVELFRNIAELFLDRAPPNPQALATEIVSFTALTIGAEDRGTAANVRTTRYYLRRRIIEYIERNLGDSELSPKKIAANSRISLSYLYSLFNDDETTVGQFVQAKRLQRAYEILVADLRGHRTVSEVAYEVGFKNVSHFSRSFSRRFNMAPRDVRQLTCTSSREPADKAAHERSLAKQKTAANANGLSSLYWTAARDHLQHETVR